MLVKTARKIAIFIIGSTIVVIGIIMIVAPGPAVIVIPAGLAVLGTEFVWAKLLLKKMKAKTQGVFEAMGFTGSAPAESKPPESPAAPQPDMKNSPP